ncbi:hypothetical protein [Streptomyces sp. AM 2-1-1]|uniref:hypothetical protein n=1 Tax=Streptomyces sp. AM 2-1-1 TaxID=3028709 RepID=UPI0023B9A6FD|nr:hypothetical protein [Streptomyces sp. AM 2-1-1]WEH38419.1 hypothetical protein PZB77_02240 [Streptomyces sp. AM 2-1-1]
MLILVPEEPVFITRFLGIEEPLLHSLYYFYLRDLSPDEAEVILRAYESWGEIQKRIPAPLRWQTLSASVQAPPRQEPEGYRLHSPTGKRLVSLHAVEVSGEQICWLEACHRLLEEAEKARFGALAGALGEIREHGTNLVENFRRALNVLRIHAPPKLLASLKQAAPHGPFLDISLDGDQQAEYATYRDQVVFVLSSGDWFASTMHRALYL